MVEYDDISGVMLHNARILPSPPTRYLVYVYHFLLNQILGFSLHYKSLIVNIIKHS